MPKFYVDAGELRKIVDAADPMTAAVEAFRTLEHEPVKSLRSITIVSEIGFDANSENDWGISTTDILEQSDQYGQYKPDL